MNKKISAIIMALVIAMVAIPSAMATDATGNVGGSGYVCNPPTLSMSLNKNVISFGSVYPNTPGLTDKLDITLTEIPDAGGQCSIIDVPATLSASGGNTWDDPAIVTTYVITPSSVTVNAPQTSNADFTTNVGAASTGTHSVTITITANY